MKEKIITRTVLFLSIVSLLADVSSELLYPIMPLYLKSIGMGAVYIGLLEGVAEAMAGLSKTYFGKLSDRSGRRMPFVWFGYMLSSFSKSATGLIANPVWVLLMRSSDRLGKGIRTASRDAILSDEATVETKGAIFGFHRSLDTIGAFLGPILALVYLHYYPGEYRNLFIYALIPAVLAVIALSFVKEKRQEGKIENGNAFWSSLTYWKMATPEYKRVIIPVLIFTLVNSSDMFLLLKVKESGHSDVQSISLYIFYNFIYAATSFQMGMFADKIGKKKVFVLGLIFFGVTYGGMAFVQKIEWFYVLFFFYGLFAACYEGIIKAWISNLCHQRDLATAIGFQATTQSVTGMFASFSAGAIWHFFGSQYVFMLSSIVTFVVATLLYRDKKIG